MSLSPLQLAIATFQANDIRIISINESHPRVAHIYYSKDKNIRVMCVPKHSSNANRFALKLQEEIGILISRSPSEQQKLGHADGGK